jgi:hypothetical protein
MEYTFFKDTLGTIWYRDCFQVEAETYELACEQVKKISQNDDIDDMDGIDFEWSEPLYETWNETPLKDNDGFSTVEFQDEEGRLIYRNGI